ncbi:hypothetical protein [Flavobacterium sp. LM4]|uniref:hypothetical protein n=1 Tax=Flavobacterium sp. LM4 TaxID=1938609 RepID=UPI00099270A1|nr:hypothetical protein [Flavobacterium sp. LM4]OOV12594.1 hypothetical protein BXU10_24475 [Flavobacterium sp. LM4]OOV19099.1 hypothetical protein BXU10_05355 [Flavobacterium sp. LM4]
METSITPIVTMATSDQKRLIAIHTPNKDTKEEWVQWATADEKRTSTNDLTFDQANRILKQLGLKEHVKDLWSKFDKKNAQHMSILAILRIAQWTKKVNGKEVADLDVLDHFLKTKSPVKKPLKKMNYEETSKVIHALNQSVKWIFSK